MTVRPSKVLKTSTDGADADGVADAKAEQDPVRAEGDAGFTIPELLVSMLVFAVLSTVVGAFMTVGLRTMSTASQRILESKDAQVVSAYLDGDVQSQRQIIGTECSKAAGETRLIGFQKGDTSTVVYYASTTAGTVIRRACGIGGSLATTNTLVRNLGSIPGVLCDGGTCTAGSAPDKVILGVTTKSGYKFNLAGTRRTYTDPIAPVTTLEPDWPKWGRTLTLLGDGDVMKLDSQTRMTVNGDVAVNSKSTPWCKACNTTTFTVNDADGVLQQPLVDPLVAVPYPDVSAMSVFDTPDAAGNHYRGPGVYRYEADIKQSYTFAAGIYVFERGFKISGSSTGVQSDITGSGVMLFNGCAVNSPASCVNDGRIQFSGGARVNLTAPTSGPYAGIVMMQARGNVAAATLRAGGAALNFWDGLVYIPTAKIVTINVEPGAFLAITALMIEKLDAGSGDYVIGRYP